MRRLRIDVGPEAVLGDLQRLPEALRPPIAEAEMVYRLDRLETVLPRHCEPQRRAVLLWHRLAIGASRQKSEFVGRLRDRQPFGVRPRIPGLALARGHR